MANQVTEPKAKSLMAAQKDYVASIGKGLQDMLGSITPYQAICGYNILAQINIQLQKEGLNFKSPEVDKETINNAIKYVMVYSLNTDNREVFTIIRNEKRGQNWVKVVEVKPQYRGILKMLATIGRNVKKVYPEWIVREGDPFKYQSFKGTTVTPPEWEPHGTDGKILRVVVPIEYNDGFVDYRIAERESVATNIKAQIKQSLMNRPNKEEILAKIQDMTLDELLTDKTLANYVNDTYTGLSREEMLITKLVLNAIKRVPMDYSSALARELHEKTFDNADVYVKDHNAEEVLAQAKAPMLEDVKEIETKDENVERETQIEKAKELVDEDGVVTTDNSDFYSIFEDGEE